MGPVMSRAFFTINMWRKRQAEVRDIFCRGFAKNKPLATQRWQPDPPMTSWYLRYAENPWNLFPEIWTPTRLHPGLQLEELSHEHLSTLILFFLGQIPSGHPFWFPPLPQLQGLARPVAGLVPLPQNLAVPMDPLDPLDRPSRTTQALQTFSSFLPSGFWAKSSVFRPVGLYWCILDIYIYWIYGIMIFYSPNVYSNKPF